jgi:hypothetical protein
MTKQSPAGIRTARGAIISVASVLLLMSCSSLPSREDSVAAIKSSFNERGIAKLDRLDQTEIQRVCSEANASLTPQTANSWVTGAKASASRKTGAACSSQTQQARPTAPTATPATKSAPKRSATATKARAS